MSSFTAQQKKDLEPLARRVYAMNAALDAVDEACTCHHADTGTVDGPQCPVYGSPHCRTTVVTASRIQFNLIRLAHDHLSDDDLVDAIRALGRVFAGLADATSHAMFANDILLALRGEPAFDEPSGERR